MFVSGTSFVGSELLKGTLLKNNGAIMDAVIKIDSDISIIGELLPQKSDNFIRLSFICKEDLASLSYGQEQKDVLAWIGDTKSHFKQLDDELDILIKQTWY